MLQDEAPFLPDRGRDSIIPQRPLLNAREVWVKMTLTGGFRGGLVVKNLPANAGLLFVHIYIFWPCVPCIHVGFQQLLEEYLC